MGRNFRPLPDPQVTARRRPITCNTGKTGSVTVPFSALDGLSRIEPSPTRTGLGDGLRSAITGSADTSDLTRTPGAEARSRIARVHAGMVTRVAAGGP